jgi:hypothetical protein
VSTFLILYIVLAAVAWLAEFVFGGLAGWLGTTAEDRFVFGLISAAVAVLWLPVTLGLLLSIVVALLFRAIGPRPVAPEEGEAGPDE